MGCGSSRPAIEENWDMPRVRRSQDDARSAYYAFPRRGSEHDKPFHRAELPVFMADEILRRAPHPSNFNMHGRRPHAHLDRENHFAAERARLKPLDRTPAEKQDRRLWAYPVTDWDYAAQNRNGWIEGRKAPGTRIITDRDKNRLGAVYHPPEDPKSFIRVPELVQLNPAQRTGGRSKRRR